MPDYKRLVSYMYTYEDGKKRSNVGYARVEARNGQCKFTIHVSALSYNEKQVTVYAFKRNKNEIEGIQLGKLNFRNEVGDFRLVTDPSRILNTGYAIEDIGGIVLYNTNTKYLATVWDENPLTMDMVASLEFKETNRLKAEANVVFEEEKEAVKEPDNVVSFDKIIEDTNYNVKETDARNVDNIIDSITKNTNQFVHEIETEVNSSNQEENLLETETNSPISEKNSTKIQENDIKSVGNPPESIATTGNPNDENVHDLSRGEDRSDCNTTQSPVKDILNRNQSNNCYDSYKDFGLEDSPIASKMFKEYPRMHPFEDNEISWCVRIEPKDIGVLPVDVWPLANNSFLLHGFYGHRHLIFAKVNNKNSNSYIIGVPGIYHNRERFMAKMFGFENFKCAKKRDRREGEFGYWYVPVKIR